MLGNGRLGDDAVSDRLHERWEITGPDGEGYVWLNLEGEVQQHINLGTFDQVGEKLAGFLAAADFGDN